MYISKYIYMYIHTKSYIHTYIYIYIFIYTYIYIHTYIYIYEYIYICIQTFLASTSVYCLVSQVHYGCMSSTHIDVCVCLIKSS